MESNKEGIMQSEPLMMFSSIRGRSLLSIFFLAMVVPVLGAEIVWPELFTEVNPLLDAIVPFVMYFSLAILIWIACLRAGIANQVFFGNPLSTKQTWIYGLLGVPLVAIAVFSTFLLYIPLSYVSPEFVVSWVLETPPIIWWEPGIDTVLASGINALVLVVVGPVIEEVFFRGFLLNRWHQKYGIVKAVVFSSTIFAILHVDILGGFVFGVVLSLLYLKTKSLIGPIVIHISNNAIVLMVLLVEGAIYGGNPNVTLDEFRAYWWIAPLGAVIGIPWLMWFCRKFLSQTSKSVV
ncbi:MAG: type II CAAX endopeptidase family protein [Pseudomonas marincola]